MSGRRKSIGIVLYRSCLCLLLVVLLVASAAAADAMFRANPEHTGVYDNGGVEPGNTELWSITDLINTSSPTVANGVFYVGSEDKNLYAIDAVTGKEKWRFATGDKVISSPAVSNGVVYFGSYDKNLYAIDTVTGKEKWRFATGDKVISSPAVSNGAVYVGSEDKNLYAIDTVTGKEKWRFATGDKVISSPAVSNGVVYFGSYDKNLYAIDAVTGKEKWRFTTGGSVVESPAVWNGFVYVVSYDNYLWAIDAVTGKEKWHYHTGITSSPAVANGVIYIEVYGLIAIDAVTGKEKWKFLTGYYAHSSPAVSNGVVYFGSYDKNLYAIDAATGKEKWRFATGDKVISSPAVSNGVVFFASDGLYAIGGATTPSVQGIFSSIFGLSNKVSDVLLAIFIFLGLLLLTFGGYRIYRRKITPPGDQPLALGGKEAITRQPAPTSSQSAPVNSPNGEDIPKKITAAEQKASLLSLFNIQAQAILTNARKQYRSGAWDTARTTLGTAEQVISSLKKYETQFAQWKAEGHDTTPLEKLKRKDIATINSVFQDFEQDLQNRETREQLRNRAEYLSNQVNNLLTSLQQDGAIIPWSLDPIRRKMDEGNYNDAIIAAEKAIVELSRIPEQYKKAKVLKTTVTDPEIAALFESGRYEEFIRAVEGQQETIRKITDLKEKGGKLLAEMDQFARVPVNLCSDFKEKLKAQDIPGLENVITGLEAFKRSAKPELEIGLENTIFTADKWLLTRVALKNTGSAHATDALLSFSEEFQTKGIKPVSIPAGSTKPVEFTLLPKNAGKILLEARVTFNDTHGKQYRKVQEFWIDVVEKGQILPESGMASGSSDSHHPQIKRTFEFFGGHIRVKISVKNFAPSAIHDVILDPENAAAREILYLERYEPKYPSENGKIILGTIYPGNDKTVALYFEPTICSKEGTDVHCHVRYKDAQGKPGSIDMEPLRIQIICPIFETKEPMNIGMLKQLIEDLPSRDSKVFSVPENLEAQTQLTLLQSIIQLHDVRHVGTLKSVNNFESWYYGKTKVTQKDVVIKLGVVKDKNMIEIAAYSNDQKDITGLLAEIGRHVTEELSKRGPVQTIFNINIKDSVIQRSNLLDSCNTEGKCSGNVTIEGSVVTGSNIG